MLSCKHRCPWPASPGAAGQSAAGLGAAGCKLISPILQHSAHYLPFNPALQIRGAVHKRPSLRVCAHRQLCSCREA